MAEVVSLEGERLRRLVDANEPAPTMRCWGCGQDVPLAEMRWWREGRWCHMRKVKVGTRTATEFCPPPKGAA